MAVVDLEASDFYKIVFLNSKSHLHLQIVMQLSYTYNKY